ncbi:unnamed protein product [Nezara viridula]|uniref:Ras-associating domain-containing protein n=1 Tax=Nezara viridula TaxID=85310 RepID=A0A9P0GWI9_NEZVI|nr:unnamed protein product [Nezara viridula]
MTPTSHEEAPLTSFRCRSCYEPAGAEYEMPVKRDLEFHGVMRFYFQDSGQKVATKCIRVASDATAQVVIETLIEKFQERRLEPDEKPLLVQLNWHKDDREGRFLLRRIDDKTNMPEGTFQEGGSSFRRKLSKREKKQLKKQEKLNRMKSAGLNNDENDSGVAEKLYTELPETSFTRSISNPEAVMRRRRQQKLERKLQQFRSKDGGPDTGGTLKIYGEALCRDVPYKTLLLSIGDTAAQVVKEMLMKYGLDKEEPQHYCLLQVNSAIEENKDTNHSTNTLNQREYILDDDECPLAILMNHPLSRERRSLDSKPETWSTRVSLTRNQFVCKSPRLPSQPSLPLAVPLSLLYTSALYIVGWVGPFEPDCPSWVLMNISSVMGCFTHCPRVQQPKSLPALFSLMAVIVVLSLMLRGATLLRDSYRFEVGYGRPPLMLAPLLSSPASPNPPVAVRAPTVMMDWGIRRMYHL